jgi:hypothetical protein
MFPAIEGQKNREQLGARLDTISSSIENTIRDADPTGTVIVFEPDNSRASEGFCVK